jgi:uncharacterized C2H2 Zn-finger protein
MKDKSYYKFTTQSFEALREALHEHTLSKQIVDALQPLQNQLFIDEQEFLHAVYNCIEEEREDKRLIRKIRYSASIFIQGTHELHKRQTEHASRCPRCRYLQDDDKHASQHCKFGEEGFLFPKAYASFKRIAVVYEGLYHYDGHFDEDEYVLQCPHCGLCYLYYIQRDVYDVDCGRVLCVEGYSRRADPIYVAETYIHVLHQTFPALIFERLLIRPETPLHMVFEARVEASDEQVSLLHDFAQEWATHLGAFAHCCYGDEKISCTPIITKKTLQTPHKEEFESPSYVVDVKEIGRLFYGGKLEPLYLEDSCGGQIAIAIETIRALHIPLDAPPFSHIVVKTINGDYVGTIRHTG